MKKSNKITTSMIEKSLVSDFMDVPELLSPSEIKIGQITNNWSVLEEHFW